jgi:hypothetical protein
MFFNRLRIILFGFLSVVVAACGYIPASTPPSIEALTPGLQEIATPDRTSKIMTKMPERVPPTEGISPITGEVPAELLDTILKDLSDRIHLTRENIIVIQDQAIVWNDGSLGCPQPGVFYTQAQVNGYWVILEAEGKRYDYHATDRGYFFLCNNGFLPIPPRSTPGS